MANRGPVLVAAAFLLLGAAWLVGNPPGAAPDEPAHYLKALAAGRGELYLSRRPAPPPDVDALDAALRWHLTTSRLVRVPAGLDPSPLLCSAFHPDVSAGCLDRARPGEPTEAATIVGPYQPFTYVLPGVLMRLAADPQSATRFGRLGFWLVSATLLGLATFLLWSPGDEGWPLVGLFVATTPMVLFVMSVLSANGVEIAAGLCFGAALLRLARSGEPPAWVWAATAGSGAALALSRVTGVVWLGLDVLAVTALIGVRPAVRVVRQGGTRAKAAAVALGTAVAASMAWELAVQPRQAPSVAAAIRGLRQEISELPEIFKQAVGVFGWLDTPMPSLGYWVWTALLLALIVLALLVGGNRQRLVLGALTAGSVVVTVALATLNRPTGFGVQARYVLPFVTIVPLMAGEVLSANRTRLPTAWARLLVPLFAAAAAGVHVLAWYANGHRYAVGSGGPRWFLGRAEWDPPLGWLPWLGVTIAAAAALLAAAVLAISREGTPAGGAARPRR